MASIDYPGPIRHLILQLRSLPGLGPRSAERMALWLMGRGSDRVAGLGETLTHLQERVALCPECGFFVEAGAECALCHNPRRQGQLLCVVEEAADVLRLERSGAFQGLYHVLGGKLSPLDDVGPEALRLDALKRRVEELHAQEVILALSADVEGEATSHYIAAMLRDTGVAVTRLAQGMPAGGGLDHVDEMTLHHALSGRRKMAD